MKCVTTLMAAAIALGSAFTAANAATMVSGNVCEGGVPPAGSSPCPTILTLGDFGTNFTANTLDVVGDTHIWGGVAHRDDGNNGDPRFFDNWAMNLGGKVYKATFNWQVKHPNFNPNFDGQIVVGDTLSGSTIVGGTSYEFTTGPEDSPIVSSGTIELGNLTGDGLFFSVDPIFGLFTVGSDRKTHEVGTWDLQLVEIAPVPLPASAALLLAGLAGLGATRRLSRKA